ncbi:hypothetical protein WICPIJ_008967 [Wickerhamomyces pijperi]|uniref:Uncharacterized protein n=1 Tax=Wickerhamomyces pijperi TaxID=599730 RepID=A0A9P8PTW5_WICPI|nr:hypothetical protein WICPIJ_008967 [Wickerhamomyces pijperi]
MHETQGRILNFANHGKPCEIINRDNVFQPIDIHHTKMESLTRAGAYLISRDVELRTSWLCLTTTSTYLDHVSEVFLELSRR